jgi:uncharacterized RDD family membrane protein YckC
MQNPPPPPPPPGDLPPPLYTPPPAPLASPSGVPAGYSYTPQPSYGGFWIRFLASLIDSAILYFSSLIVSVIVSTIGTALGWFASASTYSPEAPATVTPIGLIVVALLLLAFLVWNVGYFVYFWSTGGTLGMKLLRLRVADADTFQPIGIGRALLRYLGIIVASLACYIGLIWAAFDDRKQGWHDKIANTVVIWG